MNSYYEINVESPYQHEIYSLESNPNLPKTAEERHYYAMFIKGNRYNKNGRTWIFIDENGEHVSSFVSQYSNIIENNLEPEVKEAVLALHKKGYLTFTSCQGHEDSKHRYIGVVFNTKDQKNAFIEDVKKLSCDIYFYDNAINTIENPAKKLPWWSDGISLHIVYDRKDKEKSSIKERRSVPYSNEDLINFWNIQMCRNYTNYESIIISFGYPIVENSLYKSIMTRLFHNKYKVTSSYYNFLNRIYLLPNYYA